MDTIEETYQDPNYLGYELEVFCSSPKYSSFLKLSDKYKKALAKQAFLNKNTEFITEYYNKYIRNTFFFQWFQKGIDKIREVLVKTPIKTLEVRYNTKKKTIFRLMFNGENFIFIDKYTGYWRATNIRELGFLRFRKCFRYESLNLVRMLGDKNRILYRNDSAKIYKTPSYKNYVKQYGKVIGTLKYDISVKNLNISIGSIRIANFVQIREKDKNNYSKDMFEYMYKIESEDPPFVLVKNKYSKEDKNKVIRFNINSDEIILQVSEKEYMIFVNNEVKAIVFPVEYKKKSFHILQDTFILNSIDLVELAYEFSQNF